MKLLKTVATAFTALAMTAAFSACGGGDDDNGGVGGIVPPAPGSALSPEDVKEYIEDTAIEFLQTLSPSAEQRQLSALSEYVASNYGELDIPVEWEEVADRNYSPARMVRALAKAAKSHSFAPVAHSLPTFRLGQFTGIYEPGLYRWTKTGESNNVVFRFRGNKGDCELAIAGSGAPWSIDTDDAIIEVPGELAIRLTEGSTRLADVVLKTQANLDAMTANANVVAAICGIDITANMQMSNTLVSGVEHVGTNGTVHQTAEAKITGTRMLQEDVTAANLRNGEAKLNLMNKLTVIAQADINQIYKQVGDNEFGYWSNWDYDEPEANRLCEQGCALLNKYVSAGVNIGQTGTQATLEFKPSYYEYKDYYYNDWEWTIEPVLVYADGSSQSFEELADSTDLWNLESQWDSLLATYHRVWNWLF